MPESSYRGAVGFGFCRRVGRRQAVKALDFDSSMRRFESYRPSQPPQSSARDRATLAGL